MNLLLRTGIPEVIKKNLLPLFSHPTPKTIKEAEQITMLKHDVELFSCLYIVMQHREGDMATFFKNENHPYPPSLSDRGNYGWERSQICSLLCLQKQKKKFLSEAFDVKVLDGTAIVHLLSTKCCQYF